MKMITKIYYTLSILIMSICFGQENCDLYLDQMNTAIEKNNIDKAKQVMHYYYTCKEDLLGDQHPVVKTLSKIEYITRFDHGRAVAKLKNGKYLIIDKNITMIKELSFEKVFPYLEEFALVYDNKKYGFIDLDGKIAIPLQYDFALSFFSGFAEVANDQKNGYIDKNGYFSEINHASVFKDFIQFDTNNFSAYTNTQDVNNIKNKDLFLKYMNEAIHIYLPIYIQNSATKFVIPIEFIEKQPRFLTLLLISRMIKSYENKREWIRLLPLMTDLQICELDFMLKVEQKDLKSIINQLKISYKKEQSINISDEDALKILSESMDIMID